MKITSFFIGLYLIFCICVVIIIDPSYFIWTLNTFLFYLIALSEYNKSEKWQRWYSQKCDYLFDVKSRFFEINDQKNKTIRDLNRNIEILELQIKEIKNHAPLS